MKRILPCLMMLGLAAGTVGCGASSSARVAVLPKTNPQEDAVKSSAKQMYRMFLKGDVQGFCRFVAPAGLASLAHQFPKSGLTSRQICVVISAAAFKTFLDNQENHDRLRESLTGVDDIEVVITGTQARMGDQDHSTSFQKINGRWRPVMPHFSLPDNIPSSDDMVQA